MDRAPAPSEAAPADLHAVGVEPWPFIAWLAAWHGRSRHSWPVVLRAYFEARAGLIGPDEGRDPIRDLRMIGMTDEAARAVQAMASSDLMPAGAWWALPPEKWAARHVEQAVCARAALALPIEAPR